MKDARTPFSSWRVGLVTLAFIASPAVRLSAQPVTVKAVGNALHVRAPGFGFIEGRLLDRLKDGRSLRFDLELAVLAKPGAPAVRQSLHSFILSYDLWEERFAVTRIGTPEAISRSISHLTSTDAAAWCLEQLTVPVSGLGRLGRDAPFWIRLEYRVQEQDRTSSSDDGAGYSLRGLIDMLSRRRKADELRNSIEAGPFTLTN